MISKLNFVGHSLLAVALMSGAAGCAAPMRSFVNNEADMTLYQNVVIVPFANFSTDPFAGARVTRAFTTELVIANRFRLADPALLLGDLARMDARMDNQGQYEPAKLKEAVDRLSATAYIRGAVTEYTMKRAGTDEYPVLSFDVEMVDNATGNVVWRISLSQTGKGRLPVVGTLGERSFGRVTQTACKRAVGELSRIAF